MRALSDTVALLNADDPEKLLRELRRAGYLPVSDDAPKTPALRAPSRSTPPSARPAAPPTVRSSRRAARTDTVVDWDRIAEEDIS